MKISDNDTLCAILNYQKMTALEEDNFINLMHKKLLPSTELTNKKVISLEELGLIVKDINENLHLLTTEEEYPDIISKLIEHIVKYGCPSSLDHSKERDYEENDFSGTAENAVICLDYLQTLLPSVMKMTNSVKYSFMCSSLVLFAVHHTKYMWSKDESIISSKDFFTKLKSAMGYKDLSSMLNDENFKPSVFCGILHNLKPFLVKSTWKKNPGFCQAFIFFLLNTKHPFLADYLRDVLPPSLMFIDHYNPDNKVLGIRCFDHIIDNVPPSSLKMYGEADVIYDALRPLVYSRELPVINSLYPCLLKLMMAQKKGVGSNNTKLWDSCDEVFHQLLINVEMEGSITHQLAYLKHVSLYLEEITSLKHLKHTLQVLKKTIELSDGPEESMRIESLKSLIILIKKCWPRIKGHCDEILTMVMILLYDTKSDRCSPNNIVRNKIIDLCAESLKHLQCACPQEFQLATQDVIKDHGDLPGVDVLKNVIALK